MEGLNKLCLWPCTSDHEYASMHGLGSIVTSRSRPKLKIPNQWGITHINSGTYWLRHFWPFIFSLHQIKTPVFTKNCRPKSNFFHIVQNFRNVSLKDLKWAGIWEKGTQMPPILWLLSLKYPLYFCLACTWLREMLLCQTQSEFRKFCILETESWNLVNTFRYKSNKGVKTKFQFYRLNWPIMHYGSNSLEGRDRPSTTPPTGQTQKRICILQSPSVWFCTSWLSKQMRSVPEAVRAVAS